MLFTPIFQNPVLQAFFGGPGEKSSVSGLPFSWQHRVELESGKEDPEQNYKVLRGHLAGPTLPGTDAPETAGTSPLPTATPPTNGRQTLPRSANNSAYTSSTHVRPLPQLGTAPAGNQDTFRNSQSQHPLKGFF